MGSKRHTLAVFIGRFQPFHIGHHDVVASMATQADSMLILIGSAYRARSWKKPFQLCRAGQFRQRKHPRHQFGNRYVALGRHPVQ